MLLFTVHASKFWQKYSSSTFNSGISILRDQVNMYLSLCAGRWLFLLLSPLGLSWCGWQLDWPTERPSSSHQEEPEGRREGGGLTREKGKKEQFSQLAVAQSGTKYTGQIVSEISIHVFI